MLKIRKVIVGPLMTNCYILSSDGECVIIDAGGNAQKIIDEIELGRYNVKFIMATHGHFDHFLSVAELQKTYNVPFMIHENDLKTMNLPELSINRFFPELNFEMPENIVSFNGTFHFNVGDHEFTIMETPGHTPGSVCIIGDKFMLTGDTLFRLSIGRTDLGGNEKQMLSSLKKLTEINESTRIYPGHGDPSDIRYEILNNIFFQNVANKNSIY